MTDSTESDPVGTVRRGFPREQGTVLVKTSRSLWTVVGGPRSGCHTFPSARIPVEECPVIGIVPGLPDVQGGEPCRA